MSFGGNAEGGTDNGITPKRLELSLDPSDGSLLVAPLSSVLLGTTDGLYQELYNMAQGELPVATAALPTTEEQEDDQQQQQQQYVYKSERLANLSFAQRRHEISWRLAQHAKSCQHVAALCGAAAVTELGASVKTSSQALQQARTAWVQADTAQDALYFDHAQLFPQRAAPHDVYGALDLLIHGRWYDLPLDLRLRADPYSTSRQAKMSKPQVEQEWHMAVRRKLLLGEIGRIRPEDRPYRIALHGGTVRLTSGEQHHGRYPLEALLTVMTDNEKDDPEPHWTLLSLEIHVQAKTGEGNHQLELSNRQRFDLHRLAARAMSREEALESSRPLEKLFEVAHTFLLSWQLEVLSAQAQALRRGVWAATRSNSIAVEPVYFYSEDDDQKVVLGTVSIGFWKIDDSYGRPAMADLKEEEGQEIAAKSLSQQLTLSIRAHPVKGMAVSLSGGELITQEAKHKAEILQGIDQLLAAASDPFDLSASDALLAATRLCARLYCRAVVDALKAADHATWVHVSADPSGASLTISAHVSYQGYNNGFQEPTELFRMVCDSRSGCFVATFPPAMKMLRELADDGKDENWQLRLARVPPHRRRVVGSNSSGRVVKDAFDGAVRSLNLLGQRTGVGAWNDEDGENSIRLRDRAIRAAAADAHIAIAKCSGLVAQYGLAPVAMQMSTGVEVSVDAVGTAHDDPYLGPPVSLLLDQEVVESTRVTTDGIKKTNSCLSQSFFSIACVCNDDRGPSLVPLEIETQLASPTEAPVRQKMEILSFPANGGLIPEAKRPRREFGSFASETSRLSQILQRMDILAEIDEEPNGLA